MLPAQGWLGPCGRLWGTDKAILCPFLSGGRGGFRTCICTSSPLPHRPSRPAAIPPADEPSPLERLEALEAKELRLLAVGCCDRLLPEVEDRLVRVRAEQAELAAWVTRVPARV